MSKIQNISVVSFLAFSFIVGILIFSRGFLLNRTIISDKSGTCSPRLGCDNGVDSTVPCSSRSDISSYLDWCSESASHSKFIVLLIDALKFDFIKRMDFLHKIVGKYSHPGGPFSCLFKFVADPPTTTMQRLKALTTGTMPTFIDASANFNSYEVDEDSLVFQIFMKNRRIAFTGDDTWLSLFPHKYFTSSHVDAHPSFNAWDLDTVDTAVNKSLRTLFSQKTVNDWDVLIAHILGVDHCGHRYGPNHPEMQRKLSEADEMVKLLYESMDNDTLLVIFGDHGMTETGDHGGDSRDESESALAFITKSSRAYLSCPQDLAGKPVEVSQIDLVPTVSTLMGISIPYSSIGQIIPNFLPASIQNEAVAANVAQINRYVSRYSGGKSDQSRGESQTSSNSMQSSLLHLYQHVTQSFSEFKSYPTDLTKERQFHESSKKYFDKVKSIAKTTWTQFDIPLMYTGIFTSLLSLICLGLYLLSVTLFEETKTSYSVVSWIWLSLAHWTVLMTSALSVNYRTRLGGIVISTLTGLIVFVVILAYKIACALNLKYRKVMPVSSNNNKQLRGKTMISSIQIQFKFFLKFAVSLEQSEIIAIVLYSFTCLGVFSNSFVINEGLILGNVLLTVVVVHLLCSRSSLATLGIPLSGDMEDNKYIVKLPVVKKYFKCSWLSFLFLAILIRTSHNFFRCREELTDCKEEYLLHKQLSSLPSDWVVHKFIRYGIELLSLAVFVVIFRHWLMYRQISASSRPSALVARYIPTVLVVLNCTFRALQGLPLTSAGSSHFRPVLEHLPRVFYTVSFGALVVVWFKPLCCIGKYRCTKKENLNTENSNASVGKSSSRVQFSPHELVNSGVSQGLENGFPSSKSTFFNGGSDLGNSSHSVTAQLMGDDSLSEDVFTSSILAVGTLVTLLIVQVTSEGMSPSITLIVYTAVCLVGIYRNTPSQSIHSWSAVIAWCLASQYFFYATGHQPVFSAIPWDSAFIASSNSSLGSSPDNIITWIPPALAVMGNMYVSPIIFSFLLPLLAYWKADKDRSETLMGNPERGNAFVICGKFISLYGFKVLMCLICAAWQRRHLMVWKIFAPKLIFEVLAFIVMSASVVFTMVLIIRIDYKFRSIVSHEKRRAAQPNRY